MCKVFGLGYPRTGTTTLREALRIVGYEGKRFECKIMSVPITDEVFERELMPTLLQDDAFTDMPWPLLYRTLDARFPNAKFILTTRDPDSWVESMLSFYTREVKSAMRQWVYGYSYPRKHEDAYIMRFLRHTNEVVRYFRGRDDLLVYDVRDGWEPLCEFLGNEVPNVRFPHLNKRSTR